MKLLTLVLCSLMAAHTAVPQPTKYYTNPDVYMYGDVEHGVVFEDNGNQYTLIRFQPHGTLEFYTEPVLFCGNAAPEFNGKTSPVVVSYEREAHRSIYGVGCHIIDDVKEIK